MGSTSPSDHSFVLIVASDEVRRRWAGGFVCQTRAVRQVLAGIAVLVVAASCASPDESVVADQALSVTQPSASVTAEQPDGSIETTTTTASTSAATTSTTTDPQVAAPPPLADDLEVRGSPVKLLFFNHEGAFELDAYGDIVQIVDGPISELADDGLGGVVFQRPDDEQRIWWLPVGAGEPSIVVEVDDESVARLEGVNVGVTTSEVIYQRLPLDHGLGPLHVGELNALDLGTGVDTELDVTDGHEHATSIIQVRNGVASGAWSTETNGVYLYDLVNRVVVYNPSRHAPPEFDDAYGFVVAPDASQVYSVETRRSESGFDDRMALISREIGSDSAEVVAEYEWSNADWYPTGLEIGDGLAFISRSRAFEVDTSEPARPLVVDLATGDSWLLSVEANVRLRHRFEVRIGGAAGEPTASSVVSTDGFDVVAADGSLIAESFGFRGNDEVPFPIPVVDLARTASHIVVATCCEPLPGNISLIDPLGERVELPGNGDRVDVGGPGIVFSNHFGTVWAKPPGSGDAELIIDGNPVADVAAALGNPDVYLLISDSDEFESDHVGERDFDPVNAVVRVRRVDDAWIPSIVVELEEPGCRLDIDAAGTVVVLMADAEEGEFDCRGRTVLTYSETGELVDEGSLEMAAGNIAVAGSQVLISGHAIESQSWTIGDFSSRAPTGTPRGISTW